MATTLRHPSHDHPFEPLDLSSRESITPICQLCRRNIFSDAYVCRECESHYYHRACAEAPPEIDHHPLHPHHPLALIHRRPLPFKCDACYEVFNSRGSSFRCEECDFDLDLSCAFFTLSDKGGSHGTTPKQIILPLHPHHTLTSFSTRPDFVRDGNCALCLSRVDGYGYMCFRRCCEFLIHKRCIRDRYYVDWTKAPRIFHDHQRETFVGEDTGLSRCSKCGCDASSGEFINCATCEVFIHRNCIQVPQILQYPPHCPGHTLVLFINHPDTFNLRICGSCLNFLEGDLCYRCTSCEFFVDVGCALQVLAYGEEGMNMEIKLSWHEHPLLLCHRTESDSGYCSYCEDESVGPMYACKEQDCEFILHKRCIEIEATIIHPHHPDHPLTLCSGADLRLCNACCKSILGLNFSCKLCGLYLHVKCAALVPTRKHYLHEHELLYLDKVPSLDCNRCGASTDSCFFRCVLCNFNLHEKCTELPPRVVNSQVHWHPLTLHESYVEDDSGEYYCDHCEKRRDVRLGVYVCGQCTARWAYHMECVLPELRKVCAKEHNYSAIERLAEEIARRDEEIHGAERKLDEMKREVDELRKKHAALVLE